MTCRYNETDWLDVLYTSVRNTPGKVADAAAFLTNRRGKQIATESLRLRLRGEGDNRLSMEMFELLVEWMEEKRQPQALDALHALNERFGLRSSPLDAPPAGDDIDAVVSDALQLATQTGMVAGEVQEAVKDRKITAQEASDIEAAARTQQRTLDRLLGTVRRLVARGPGQ